MNKLVRSRPSSLLWSRACSGLANHAALGHLTNDAAGPGVADKGASRRQHIQGLEALLNDGAPSSAVADFMREAFISKLELYVREEGGGEVGLDSTGLATLATALAELTSLAELSLTGGLGPDSARALADGLRANNSLTNLSLIGTPIGEEGARALAAALGTDSLIEAVSLPYCGIGPAGAVALAGALRSNTALRHLNLSGNHLCGKQQLPGGEWDGDHTADALAELAAALPHSGVTSLNLRHNELRVSGCVALAAALRADAPLATLNLQLNSFGDAGAVAILESLAANTHARAIDLRENKCSSGAKDAVAELGRRRVQANLEQVAVKLPEKHPKLWPKPSQIG